MYVPAGHTMHASMVACKVASAASSAMYDPVGQVKQAVVMVVPSEYLHERTTRGM
jgi:hypothetical protein